MTAIVFLDGQLVPEAQARIPVFSRAMTAGIVAFETLRCYQTGESGPPALFRADAHMDRLRASMSALGARPAWSVPELIDAARITVRANGLNGDSHLRILVFPRDDDSDAVWEPTLAMMARERPAGGVRPATCAVGRWRRAAADAMPAHVKCTANYLSARLALNEAASDGFDEVILLNDRNEVAESSRANIAIVRDGRLATPDKGAGILAGITRDSLLELCRDLGVDAVETGVTEARLRDADEVFLCSTGYEVRPVHAIDGRPVGDGRTGPITELLAQTYRGACRGALPDFAHWRMPVYD
jgi:branched-chain amino acid aminotransferase